MAVDTYYDDVVALLAGDGADGGTTFTDSGPNAAAFARVGTQVITATGVKKYGTASISFPIGSANNYVLGPSSADWAFGTNDFTVEGWIQIDGYGTGSRPIVGTSNGSLAATWLMRADATTLYFSAYGVADISAAHGGLGTFAYVAFSRVSGVGHLYVNGTRIATGAFGHNISAVTTLKVGAENTGNQSFYGYIDDLRITTGVGRYDSASHDVPSEAHPTSAPITAEADLTLTDPFLLTAEGEMIIEHGDGAVTFPAATLTGYGAGIAAATFPAMTVVGYGGGTGAATLTFPTLYAVGHDTTGEQSFTGSMPSPTVQAYGGGSAALTMPAATLSATGTADIVGTAALSLPMPTLDAAGDVSATGQAQLTAPTPMLVRGYSGAVCSITIGSVTVEATGTTGAIGRGAVTLPLFELEAEASMGIVGRAELLCPSPRMGGGAQAWLTMPMAQLTAIGTATVEATYEAYSLNLKHEPRRPGQDAPVDEMTRYTNFPFTHIVRYQNSYFGVAADGLYLLEGTTDYAATPTEIPWAWKTGTTDFKRSENKTIENAYFAGRFSDAVVTVYASDDGEHDTAYDYETPRTGARNYRQTFGRGVKARYFALGAAGEGELALDSIEFNVAVTARRV